MSNKQTKKTGLSKSLKMFYGVGDFGFTLMSNIESYHFNFFLTNLAQFPLAMVTLITTIASTVDAVLSWMYGAILNSVKPMKWGRYRSWLVAIPWLVPFLYAFQFIKLGDGWVSAIVIIIAAIASHVAWNFAYVANVSMISVAGKDAGRAVSAFFHQSGLGKPVQGGVLLCGPRSGGCDGRTDR